MILGTVGALGAASRRVAAELEVPKIVQVYLDCQTNRNELHRMGALRTQSMSRAIPCLLCAVLSGCAAITNPLSSGIPACHVPYELLAEKKDVTEPVPLSYLRQKRSDVYRLAAGDVLGIYIEGVLGEPDQAPPVNIIEGGDESPSLGFPIPVREDGTLSLPLIDPITVDGMTIEEAEKAIIRAYTAGDEPILRRGRERVIVSLVRPRQIRVLVIREDSPSGGVAIRRPGMVRSTREFRGGAERLLRRTSGTGTIVNLPPDENDVLHALTITGGLPGLDASNEIVIQRGYLGEFARGDSCEPYFNNGVVVIPDGPTTLGTERQIARIPLRWPPGAPLPFTPEDIVLQTGDIVLIEARDAELFYTGGLLPSGEYPLPRDYDLTVSEAVAQVGGPLINGGINSNNLSGALVATGLGSPSPRLVTVVRQIPTGGKVPIVVDLFAAVRDPSEDLLVKSGDMLILQETKHQAIGRYITQIFRFSLFADVISRTDVTGTTTVIAP